MNLFDVLFAKKLAGGGDYPAIIKRVTGNPVEFTDGADAPLIECKSVITGSQDLHGQTHPWVGGAGFNKWDEEWEVGSISPSDGTDQPSTTNIRSQNYIPVNANDSYCLVISENITVAFRYYDYSHNFVGSGSRSGTGAFTIPSDASYMRFVVFADYGTTYNHDIAINYPATVNTYSPYSNICPITAYTEGEIEVRGKNLLDESTIVDGTYLNDSGEPSYVDNAAYFDQYILVSVGNKYTVSFFKSDSDYSFYIRIHGYDSNKNWVSLIYKSSYAIRISGNYNATITIPTGIKYIRFSFGDTIQNAMINNGASVLPYEPYIAPTTHTTTYPSAIYRGSEDVVNGEVTSARIVGDKSDLNGSISGASAGGLQFIDSTIPFDEDVICNMLPTIPTRSTAWQGTTECISQDNNGKVRIYVNVTDYSDFATRFADLQFVYPYVATSSVTPTNLPIKSLSGYNHIESTTGDLDITYITEGYQEFVDEIESTYGRRKGGKKPIDVFRMLEGDSEPKEEDGEKEEQKEEIKK